MNFFFTLKGRKVWVFPSPPIALYSPRQVFFPFSQAFAIFSHIVAASCQWTDPNTLPFQKGKLHLFESYSAIFK